ncbi:MAG: hypothetical protein K2Q18_06885 [Bdellovibrionales bacterium]|nr:hypothetical protein [Bdellovibrionales bacterium]
MKTSLFLALTAIFATTNSFAATETWTCKNESKSIEVTLSGKKMSGKITVFETDIALTPSGSQNETVSTLSGFIQPDRDSFYYNVQLIRTNDSAFTNEGTTAKGQAVVIESEEIDCRGRATTASVLTCSVKISKK